MDIIKSKGKQLENNKINNQDTGESEITSSPLEKVRYFSQGTDLSGLVRRLNDGSILIPKFDADAVDMEGFQRNFVWNKRQMDQFIESILVGYPTPGIFLVEQSDKTLLVLDGQQRLRTLQMFIDGDYRDDSGEKKHFVLQYVTDEFKGLSYKEMSPTQKRGFDNTGLNCTYINTYPDAGNNAAIFEIFERINSSGTVLSPHEIRIATFAGPLVQRIQNINTSKDWVSIYGEPDKRLKSHELISRIFALYFDWKNYVRPMKKFINEFYKKFSKNSEELNKAEALFYESCEILQRMSESEILTSEKKKNPVFIEALFVGLMYSLQSGTNYSDEELQRSYKLFESKFNEIESTPGYRSTDTHEVLERTKLAVEVFGQDA